MYSWNALSGSDTARAWKLIPRAYKDVTVAGVSSQFMSLSYQYNIYIFIHHISISDSVPSYHYHSSILDSALEN